MEAYSALLAAGKPILESNDLQQVLQMCYQVPQPPSMISDNKRSLSGGPAARASGAEELL